eukprot:CAMPEP_0194211070 /NCGR_PEP_ID=MMETSP0156-20130528/9277_1 /TAXON_ID=33649 /ORGANISM="Thalassionema nitzschioides, Strain L26-B" /LENGTH=132 /DNA_ID=CAMNT_0038938499 /DNA_START=128 /DNA_END=523 /DNA_ORIENTATION=-
MKTWTSNEALALIPYQPEIPLHELLAVTTLKDTATDDDDIVLPSDIVPIILSYCDAKTLARASCVCQEWHSISSQNELWERLCRETFGVSAVEIRPSPDPIKCLYIWNHKHLRSMVKRLLYNNQTVPPLGSS